MGLLDHPQRISLPRRLDDPRAHQLAKHLIAIGSPVEPENLITAAQRLPQLQPTRIPTDTGRQPAELWAHRIRCAPQGRHLSDHVKEVRLSTRLTESPACLITDTFGITPALARMYRSSGQAVPVGKRILELNPMHPLVTGLQQAHKNRGDDSSLAETAELRYGTALLAEGDVTEIRQSSLDCSRTVWPAPCRTHDRPRNRPC